jgi:hypothetical protein
MILVFLLFWIGLWQSHPAHTVCGDAPCHGEAAYGIVVIGG